MNQSLTAGLKCLTVSATVAFSHTSCFFGFLNALFRTHTTDPTSMDYDSTPQIGVVKKIEKFVVCHPEAQKAVTAGRFLVQHKLGIS
jgi:hypothetical protein